MKAKLWHMIVNGARISDKHVIPPGTAEQMREAIAKATVAVCPNMDCEDEPRWHDFTNIAVPRKETCAWLEWAHKGHSWGQVITNTDDLGDGWEIKTVSMAASVFGKSDIYIESGTSFKVMRSGRMEIVGDDIALDSCISLALIAAVGHDRAISSSVWNLHKAISELHRIGGGSARVAGIAIPHDDMNAACRLGRRLFDGKYFVLDES